MDLLIPVVATMAMLGNVPLNNRLAAVSPADPGTREVWEHYLNRTILKRVVNIWGRQ